MLVHNLSWLVFPLVASLVRAGGVNITSSAGRKQCTVIANGGNKSDVPDILHAFDECGHGGNIVFPEGQNYWIDTKLNPVVNDVRIDWRGIWTVCSKTLLSKNQTQPLNACSSPLTSSPGATPPTLSLSKTIGPPSSSPEITSRSTAMAPVASTGMATRGTRQKQATRSQADPCHSSSGTSLT